KFVGGWGIGCGADWVFDPTFNVASSGRIVEAIYELRYEGGIADSAWNTSSGGFKVPATTFPFRVFDVTNPDNEIQMLLRMRNADGIGSPYESGNRIYFYYPASPTRFRWRIWWTFADGDTPPNVGDIYRWKTTMGFGDGTDKGADSYTFSTKANDIDPDEEKFFRIRVVPNPYVVSSPLELWTGTNAFNRKEVRFINLPPECTIDIYTIAGDRIKTIHHLSSLTEDADIRSSGGFLATDVARYPTGIGEARWDLLTEENLNISYGMYIYHVKTPDGRSFTGKMIVIK
ncbi:hypothetical protein IIB79_07470, partial [candidate division KSB1 bacterium]|nr:hypothetical protein [candidate division KSB1 bacterium]